MGLDKALCTSEVSPEFLCTSCGHLLLNPVTAGCEHVFCQSCITKRFQTSAATPRCPACRSELTMTTEDTSIEFKLQLLNLTIKCNNKCGNTFVLAELPDHMEICPNAPVDCDFKSNGCERTIKRRDRRKHSEECDFRPVECEACGHHTIYRELFTHQSRIRCLEKKLKQQVIRERKAAAREINRHREKLFKDNCKLDQQQRKALVNHARNMTTRKGVRLLSKDEHQDIHFEPDLEDSVFLTESRMEEHNGYKDADADERDKEHQSRHVTKTPHSSRSGFAIQYCAQCNKTFKPDANQSTACRWHIGPMIQVFGGTCFACGRLDYQPGCATGFHRV